MRTHRLSTERSFLFEDATLIPPPTPAGNDNPSLAVGVVVQQSRGDRDADGCRISQARSP